MAERFELTAQEAVERLSLLAFVGLDDEEPTIEEAFSPAKGYMRFIWSDGAVANVEVREPGS